jgi:Flp pilus assembly protein TadB
MARRVSVVRPRAEREASSEVELEALTRRQAMRLLEQARPDDPPRRLSGAGLVVIGCVVACVALYVLGVLVALAVVNP